MKRGEIWLLVLDPTHGHEQTGRRLVLIVSPEPFNRVTKVPVVVPITRRAQCGVPRSRRPYQMRLPHPTHAACVKLRQ